MLRFLYELFNILKLLSVCLIQCSAESTILNLIIFRILQCLQDIYEKPDFSMIACLDKKLYLISYKLQKQFVNTLLEFIIRCNFNLLA